ncbi:MAG: FKBP-type peptidyl-prolyl cis-trans isomerase [Phycisphaerales bacterium]|nr:FKBP-type peptidyl-prolyl cis-trans isomerase [Phycisphaerales bacterium]
MPDGPAVHTEELEGGLLIEDLVIGDGYEIKPGGAVVAYYHGTRKNDGFVFDSAFDRGEPAAFPLTGVIPGWQQGVPGMRVGGVRRLTIPAALGYGERGAGEDIPPNTDLVFVIEVVDALQIEDLTVGEGEAATGQFVAVARTSYFDETGKPIDVPGDDAPYVWIPGEMAAIDAGVTGMKVGGTRRLVVPKEMNITPSQLPTARPQNVKLTMELELIALRNLPGRRR